MQQSAERPLPLRGCDFPNPTGERGIAAGPSLTLRVVMLPELTGDVKKSQPLRMPGIPFEH